MRSHQRARAIHAGPLDDETERNDDIARFERKPRLSPVDTAAPCAESAAPDGPVERALIRDQPMVIGGPHESLKTSLAPDLAVSLATGTTLLSATTKATGAKRAPVALNDLAFAGAAECAHRWYPAAAPPSTSPAAAPAI